MKNNILKNLIVGVLSKIKTMSLAVKIVSVVVATCLVAGTIATVVVTKNNDNENLGTTSEKAVVTEEENTEVYEDITTTERDETVTDSETTEASDGTTEDADSNISGTDTNTTVDAPTTNVPTTNAPVVNNPTTDNPTENEPENNTPSVIPTRDLLDGAMSMANDAYLSLGYFENTSKLSMKDAADYIYWKSIDVVGREWNDIDGYRFWVAVPVSEFNEASMKFFGRTYNFKELDGQSLIISPYFPMEDEVSYDASLDALIITCGYGGGGGGEFDFPSKTVEVIDNNTCTITMTYTNTTTKAPTMDIPYEMVTFEYDCLTYYRYTTIEEITLTYVNGSWQYVSYVGIQY